MAGYQNYIGLKIEKQRKEQDRKAEKAEKMAARVRERKLRRLAETKSGSSDAVPRGHIIRDP